jgi:hypothetical protein
LLKLSHDEIRNPVTFFAAQFYFSCGQPGEQVEIRHMIGMQLPQQRREFRFHDGPPFSSNHILPSSAAIATHEIQLGILMPHVFYRRA